MQAVFLLYIPESPYYLLAIDDQKGAEAALVKIRSKSPYSVQGELSEMKKSVEEAMSSKSSFMDIFKSKGLTKALVLSVGLVALQQLSGMHQP